MARLSRRYGFDIEKIGIVTLVRYVETDQPLNHRKTVWLKATVRSVREESVLLEHPSAYGYDGLECDIDDLYVVRQEERVQVSVPDRIGDDSCRLKGHRIENGKVYVGCNRFGMCQCVER